MVCQVFFGERLELPEMCPAYLHELMLQCWTSTADSRICVAEVEKELMAMIESPELQPCGAINKVALSVCAEVCEVLSLCCHVSLTRRSPSRCR